MNSSALRATICLDLISLGNLEFRLKVKYPPVDLKKLQLSFSLGSNQIWMSSWQPINVSTYCLTLLNFFRSFRLQNYYVKSKTEEAEDWEVVKSPRKINWRLKIWLSEKCPSQTKMLLINQSTKTGTTKSNLVENQPQYLSWLCISDHVRRMNLRNSKLTKVFKLKGIYTKMSGNSRAMLAEFWCYWS